MAYIGVAKPTIAKMEDTGNTYSAPVVCGKAIQIDITPQYAEGSLFGDNGKAEYDKEFKQADIVLNTTSLPIAVHETMFGHTVEESSITFKDSDESNYVGFGFYVTEKVDGKKKYTATWLPKTKFSEGAESYKTKGDNIEYQTPSVTGQALALDNGIWKEVEQFDTEAEAQQFINEKISPSS